MADQSSTPLSGWLQKLSGTNPKWQKRWFQLTGTRVEYFAQQGDAGKKKPKGVIDLTTGFGARTRDECHKEINWPKSATAEASFAVATEKRTWYMIADSEETAKKWMEAVNGAIQEHGKPRDHKQDVKGKPEGDTSKFARLVGSVLGKATQTVAESGVIENEQANAVVKTAGSTVQEQAEMDPTEASAKDRLKAGAGTVLEGAGDITDNEVVGIVAEVAANQITADDDATVGERIGMLAGDITAGVVDSGLIENEQALTVIKAVGETVQEQAEMDPEETSAADRLKGIAGAIVQTGGELADNDIVATVAEAAANQITADNDATVGERIGMLAGDITAGVVDSGLIENEQALTVIKAVGETVQEQAEMDPEETSAADRLKGIAGAIVQTGGELADNDIVATVAEAAANQIKADDDATVGERIGMLAGDITAGVVDSGLIENEQALTVIKAVGETVQEQAEMDPEETSAADRLKGIAGAIVQTGGELADNDIVATVAEAAANQITADDDTTVVERIGMLAGDVSAGVIDAGLVNESAGQVLTAVTEAVTNAAETT